MTKTYGATNPQQIIDLFEMRAKVNEIKRDQSDDFEDDVSYASIARTWRAAADILRNTEFVGWSHNTRIVDDISEHKRDENTCRCGNTYEQCAGQTVANDCPYRKP